jgi:phosphate butyryltransferase
VLHARDEEIILPVLVGDKAEILAVLEKLGKKIPTEDIYDFPDPAESARAAVDLVRRGEADFLMKGRMETAVLLKAVVDREHG